MVVSLCIDLWVSIRNTATKFDADAVEIYEVEVPLLIDSQIAKQ